jgi:serine protease Do
MLSKTGGYQGIGFAIPSNMARPIMKSLIKKGRVDRGWLGVSIQTYDNAMAAGLKLGNVRGVLVADVLANSPAARAGLRRNDVILRLNNLRVTHAGKFRNLIALAGSGRNVSLDVYRNRRRLKGVRVTLGKLPGKRRVSRRGNSVGQAAPAGMLVKRIDARTRRAYRLPRNLRHGVVVTSVARTGAAAQIGLRPGDVILEVNRRRVSTPKQFSSRYRAAGSTLVLLIYRDGSTVYIALSK